MNVIPDKRSIVGLVKDANDGKLCLPDFQRDFVWPRDLVADLVRSIYRPLVGLQNEVQAANHPFPMGKYPR